MGRDKALLTVDDQPLAGIVAAQCRRGGCHEVLAVGGDRAALAGLDLEPVRDEHPGEGPLGGIITALDARADADTVVVLAVDLPGADHRAIALLIEALQCDAEADVALPVTADGRRHHLHGAWRPRARRVLAAAFDRGERAVHRALDDLRVVEVSDIDADSLLDVDTPGDVSRWRQQHGIGPGDR